MRIPWITVIEWCRDCGVEQPIVWGPMMLSGLNTLGDQMAEEFSVLVASPVEQRNAEHY